MRQPVLSTFVITWLLCVMESSTLSIFNSCSGDMIFVMDASSSIWVVDFKRQLQFVANLVDTFNIGPGTNEVSIGAITFSDNAHVDFALDRFQSSKELKKAILKIPYRTGGTNTAGALKLLSSVVAPYVGMNKRPMIAVVITDGLSWDSALTKEEAKKVHRLGINMHAIGVGDHYDMEELKAIASDPVNGVHEVTSYSALKNIADKFRFRLCEVIVQTTDAPTTSTVKTSPTTSMKTTRRRMTVTSRMPTRSTYSSKAFSTSKADTLTTVKESLVDKPEITNASTPSKTKNRQNKWDPLRNYTVETVTTVKPSAFSSEPSTTFTPNIRTTAIGNHIKGNSSTPNTIEILNQTFKTTEATTLTAMKEELTDKLRMTMSSISSGDEIGNNKSDSPENIAVATVTTVKSTAFSTEPSTAFAPKIATKATGNHIKGHSTKPSTVEILNRTFKTTEGTTLTTMKGELTDKPHVTLSSISSRYEIGNKESDSTEYIAVGDETDIQHKDYISTIVFGFDLMSLGLSHTDSLIQFINHVLPYLKYGKVALISNTRCPQNFNIPLSSRTKEDIANLLRRLSEAKYPGVADIVRQMNRELIKGVYFKGEEKPTRQIGILFVDLSVSEITSEVLMEADLMKKNGFELFVISIGDVVWADIKMAMALSSQPHNDYVLSVPTYKDLLQIVKRLPLLFKEISYKYGK